MKRVIDRSVVLGTVAVPEGACEVCASADARYDGAAGRLEVRLESFLRPAALRVKERHVHAEWLPADETVTESGALEEAHDEAREIFHRWVGKVRAAAPQLRPV